MVDAADLKSAVRKDVPVQVRRWAVDSLIFFAFSAGENEMVELTVISQNVE
jgi:hypothetical protein